MSEGDVLKPGDLTAATAEQQESELQDFLNVAIGDAFSLKDHQERLQRHFLTRAMEQAGGVLTKAADLLGIENYQPLDAQLKRLGVDKKRWKQ